MPVTVVNKKAKLTTVTKELSQDIIAPEVVDEFARDALRLAKKMEKIAPLKKSVEGQEKAILATVDDVVNPTTGLTLFGDEHDVVLGPKGNKTEVINTAKAAELLGFDLFVELAKLSITDLNKYLTPDQVAEVTKKSPKNKRRVKIEIK
jgi:hypothetical protein